MWLGFSSSSQFQLGMPALAWLILWELLKDPVWERAPLPSNQLKPLIYSLPLPTKKQANTSVIWLWKCFCLRLYNWFFFYMALSYSAWTVAEDGCCSQLTMESRVNSIGPAVLSIPVPCEPPWIAICAMHVWSGPVGGSGSTILPLMLSGVLGTNSVL